MILLSVCIPCYNTSKYIEKCLNSLNIGNDNKEIELIIINDGSIDNTLEKINSISKKFPNVKILDKKNEGHGPAIEDGIKLATGLFFKILDSDDWFDTEALKNLLIFLKDVNKDVDTIINRYTRAVLNTIDDINSSFTYENINVEINVNRLNKNDLSKFLLPTITVKTELLKINKLEYPHKVSTTDTLFIACVQSVTKKVVFFDENLYYYFIGRSDQTVNTKKTKEQRIKIINDIFIVNYFKAKYVIENKELIDPERKNYILYTIRYWTNRYLMEAFYESDYELFISDCKIIKIFNADQKKLTNRSYLWPFWNMLSL